MLHEFKLGHNAAETHRNIIKAWGSDTTSERTVQRWFDKFRSGDTSLEEETGRGRPSLVENDQLKALVEEKPRTTVCELATALGVDASTI